MTSLISSAKKATVHADFGDFLSQNQGSGYARFIQAALHLPPISLGDPLKSYQPYEELFLRRQAVRHHFVQDRAGQTYRLFEKKTMISKAQGWLQASVELLIEEGLDNFDQTLQQIYLCVQTFKSRLTSLDAFEELAKQSLYHLYHMRLQNKQERIAYVNHTRVDQTLKRFVRYVALDSLGALFDLSEKDQHDLQEGRSPYGAQELVAFCQALKIECNLWGIWQEQWQWLHASSHDRPCLLENQALQLSTLTRNHGVMLAISPDQIQWLRLEPFTRQNLPPGSVSLLPLQEFTPCLNGYELLTRWKQEVFYKNGSPSETLASSLPSAPLKAYFEELERKNQLFLQQATRLSQAAIASQSAAKQLIAKRLLEGVIWLCYTHLTHRLFSLFCRKK